MRRVLMGIAALVLPGGALAEEPVLGTWASPPDDKGQTGHVVMAPCPERRSAFCGVLVRAYDPEGRQITTPNVGKTLLFNIRPEAGPRYSGRAFVPTLGADFPATVTVEGDVLEVRGCAVVGVVCKAQEWQRVR